jgi:DNA-binding NtrC family response regulator
METELIGRSQNILQIKKLINQVAETDLNIVVQKPKYFTDKKVD